MKKTVTYVFIILISGGILTYLIMFQHASFLAVIHSNELNKEILNESLKLGQQFLVNNQKPDGSFNYEYNFVDDSFTPGNSQVRQAGALWGLALSHQDMPTIEAKAAIEKSISFFEQNTAKSDVGLYIVYPGESRGRTGTMALVALGLIDFLRAEPDHPNKNQYDSLLSGYISQILSWQMADKRFFSGYNLTDGKGTSNPSPYFCGEILLTLCKAAKYQGYSHLKENIVESASAMYDIYVTAARKEDFDSNTTKGFYQWSSMSFYEIYAAGWDDQWAEKTIELAYWMIDTHRTLMRTRNTAYAHEGMTSAYELAKLSGDDWAMQKIGTVVDIGLEKLISWQVGGPLQNEFLKRNVPTSHIAIGGVMNKQDEPTLRIDVTQHQNHAMILAKRFIYSEE
ncbi:MAG: hypothetical protein RJQ09_01445 [Cyclobacteriaceae bacterium]